MAALAIFKPLMVHAGIQPVVIIRVAACAWSRVVVFRHLYLVAGLAFEDILVGIPDIFPIGGAGVAELAVAWEVIGIGDDLFERQVIVQR